MFLEVILLSLLLILICSRKFTEKFNKLPPGPWKWPVIGNIVEVALEDGKYPHIALAKMADKYGDVMSLQFGSHLFIVLSSYEAMKEMLVKDEAVDRYFFPSVSDRQFDPHRPLGIIWGAGEMWKKVRRYSIRNMRDFGFGSKRSFEELAAEEIQSSLSYLSQKSQKNGNILSIDLHDFSFISVNILWSLVAGKRFSVDDKCVQEWLTLSDKEVEMLSFDNKYNVFPILKRLFPKWSGYEKHAVYHQQTQEYMMNVIQNLRKERESREDKTQMTFIERFLDEIDRNAEGSNNNKNDEGVFTEQQLATVLMDIFLGGSETFGNVIAWSILYLSLNPEVQEKLYKAIGEKAEVSSSSISYEDTAKIPYLRATFLEVLRCSVFLPMPVPRAARESFKFREFIIPKDCCITWNITNVCKDEKFWGDPQAFRPERFIDSSGKIISSMAERVSAFGFGKRICMGERFGTDLSLLYLANMVRSFQFESIPGHPLSPDNPVLSITLAPQPFQVKWTSRSTEV